MAMFTPVGNAIKPPEVEDMATVQARAAQLRSMVQQGQIGEVHLREALQGEADNKIYRDAVAASGGDPVKFEQYMRDNRGNPKDVQALRATQLKIKETESTIGKNDAQGASARATAEEKDRTALGDALKSIQSLPPDERPEAYVNAAKKMQAAGKWHAGDSLDYPGDAQLHQMTDAYLGAEKTARIAKEQQALEAAKADELRKAAKAPAELATANAEAATKTVLSDQTKELGMTAQQRETIDRQTAANKEIERHNKREEGLAGGRLSIEQKRFNATLGAGLDANGRPLSTDEAKAEALKDPIAKAIAENKMLPPKSLTDRNGQGQAMMRKVLAINPDYDVVKAPARIKTENDFSASGASGKAMTAADTGLSHLNTLRKAGIGLKSGNLQILNQIANTIGAQTGNSAPAVYDAIVSMVAPEISKAVIGGVGGEGDRMAMAANFGSKASNSQREGAIGAAATLLAARVEKQKHAYESTMGRPLARELSPESQEILQSFGGKGGQGGGQVPAFPATLSQSDIGKTYINGAGKKIKITAVNPQNPKQFQGAEVQ